MNKNKIVSVLMVIILFSIITLNYGNMVFEIDHPEVFWLCGSNDLKFLAVQTTNSGRTISHIFLVLKLSMIVHLLNKKAYKF